MKQRDYKTADAPKTEPLKASLSEKLRAAWANKPGRLDANITLPAGTLATFKDESGEATVTINAGEFSVAELVAEIDADLSRKETP